MSSMVRVEEADGATTPQRQKEKLDKKKLKNLTVRPFRFHQDCPQQSLKKTFKFKIKAGNVRPLEVQVAGHGYENHQQGTPHRGMLLHKHGFVLKPVQAPPKGLREVEFYQHISTSPHPTDILFYSLVPRFYGTERIKGNSLSHQHYLILENLTQGLVEPCVMDIKIGAKTYGPDASLQKMEQEDSKYLGTKKPLGFSVLGIINRSDEDSGFQRWDKSFGLNLSTDGVGDILKIFFNQDKNPRNMRLVAAAFSKLLKSFEDFFAEQTTYHVYASSLLFVYDFQCLNAEGLDQEQVDTGVRLKIIDFAHVFPSNGQKDENFSFGLRNIQKLFQDFLA